MPHHSNGTSTPTGQGQYSKPSANTFRSGLLTLRIFSGRSLALPPDVPMPEVIERALVTHQQQMAQMPEKPNVRARDSIQRKRYWWLPYVVLEFDKNEILVDALGGDIASPSWLYKANLYAVCHSYLLIKC